MSLVAPTAAQHLPEPPPPNPREPVDYAKWVNDRLSQGMTENAADVYLQINLDETRAQSPDVKGAIDRAIDGPWRLDDRKFAQAWLDANQRNLELLREGAQRSRCFFELPKSGPLAGDPVSSGSREIRAACKMMIAEGWGSFASDPERLAGNCAVVLRVAHHLDQDPACIRRLSGVASSALTHDALIEALAHVRDPETYALAQLETIAANDPPLATMADTYRLENAIAFDIFQRISVWDDAARCARFSAEKLHGSRDEVALLTRQDFDATIRETTRFYARLIAWSAEPFHAALPNADNLDRMLADSKNALIRKFVYSSTKPRLLADQAEALRRATLVVYATWVYRARHGVFPSALVRLSVPGGRETQMDPITGERFVYRRTDDGFILYSFGRDQDDDGGRHDSDWGGSVHDEKQPDGDHVFWPPQRAGAE
ncbi:MAG: hypothetical protein C4547_07050 [Phycisphaerales bacterium]|nr:MAG: hypothetical protein C4547_07050 [Phycisphaerales bacterium]